MKLEGFSNFAPISLADLNDKAEMLARLDNKYIMPGHLLAQALASFEKDFEILEIEGKRGFAYSTLYFDDAERRCYYDHHQRKRKRIKVRIRTYVDADLHYLEVKLNDKRSSCLKKRLRLKGPLQELDSTCHEFIDACHRETYEAPFNKEMFGALRVQYERYTLVAKDGGERLTIDTAMRFKVGDKLASPRYDIFIVETKSARGNGIADKVFRSLHVQPTKRVSKFCIGMAANGEVLRHNGFIPAMKRLAIKSQAQLQVVSAEMQMPLPIYTTQYAAQHAV